MLTVGLTGQSGAGKGEFAKIFTEREKVFCLDTDIVARRVVEKGSECLCELCSFFGEDILKNDGSLDRQRLASIAFTNPEKHKALNTITHKYIMCEIESWLSCVRNSGAAVAVIDAPLLFESGADRLCDITVAVIAPYNTRLSRILIRDGIDEKAARTRLDARPDDRFFTSRCDYVIENNGDLESFREKATRVIDTILAQK